MTNWRNKIDVKKYLSNDSSNEKVLEVVNKIIPQLKHISNTEERLIERKSKKALDEFFLDEFNDLIQEFEWVKDSIQNNEDSTEFSFDNWCEALNEYFKQLYDLSDVITNDTGSWSGRERFLWVG